MKSHKKLTAIVEDVVIALLIVSAVFFGWKSRLFGNPTAKTSDLFDWLGIRTLSADSADETPALTAAAIPLCIVVTNQDRDHYGVRYDMDEIEALYGKSVVIFGEALGSAGEAEEISESEWRTALLSCGVYYEYLSPVELSLLSEWYGGEITADWGDIPVRRLCVVAGDDGNRLYFMDDDSGGFYAADAAPSARITTLAEASGINSTFFAFEMDDTYESPDSYTVLNLDMISYPVVEAADPLQDDETLRSVLVSLGIIDQNSYTRGTQRCSSMKTAYACTRTER